MTEVRQRRLVFLLLNGASVGALAAMMLALILRSGATLSEWLIGLGFLLTIPYTVMGLWNAVIGLWLRQRRPAVIAAMPGVAELTATATPPPLACRTAILLTLRNEPPAPIFERLQRMRASLAATGQLARFRFVLLSDSDQPEVIRAEQQAYVAFRAQRCLDEPGPSYRRRRHNTGYKAGNIQDFLAFHGSEYDYFLPLDADSLIGGDTIWRLLWAMEQHPEIGILQSLAVGMPSRSGFTRIFQFGMRHGMRAFTTGAAWWAADCGPYWGHNAIVRAAPFREHCQLPRVPGRPPLGGAVLSHDQLEATFMRRAGWQVRVVPVETESYEINPPTLLDFIKRELRWTQGNMQYLHFLTEPGLLPASRVQLLVALGMYLGQAAWIAMIAVACLGSMLGNFRVQDLVLGVSLFVGVFLVSIAPKLAGALDVWLSPGGPARYGGRPRFALAVLLELLVSMLMAPIVALSVTLFLLGLPLGRSVRWGGQIRSATALSWRAAGRVLAPHTLAGLALAAALWLIGGLPVLLWGLPVVTGLALAVPYAVLTAWPAVGRAFERARLFAIPEECDAPAILQAQ